MFTELCHMEHIMYCFLFLAAGAYAAENVFTTFSCLCQFQQLNLGGKCVSYTRKYGKSGSSGWGYIFKLFA